MFKFDDDDDNNDNNDHNGRRSMVYSYFMPVFSIVKTITPRCLERPDALLHEAEGRVQ